MSKLLDVIMAGVIAGTAAYATIKLGIGGTVIGTVLCSMLYQVISHIVKEPVENIKTQRIEREIFYVFPLVIILIIEVIYLLSSLYNSPEQIFAALESATGDNLFKIIGIGLIIMGLYPIIQPESIKKFYGYLLLVIGVINLLVGFIDVSSSIVQLYAPLFYQLKEVISVIIIVAITYVIIAITKESVTVILNKDKDKDNKDDKS
ncbi:MAG: hypothetical protein ACLQG5_09810 [Methanobacterium sp.]|jgi:hypothetical protein